MRVVAGTARGRPLVAPPGDRTRPTADRVREAVFNALWSRGALEGATVADLYAGSGALGIEALSRGAAHATFVDRDQAAVRAVRRNLEACGLADRATVERAPVEGWLAGLQPGTRLDLALCDPPYAFTGWDGLLAALPAALVVVESDRPVRPPTGWRLVREARYGGTWVGFLEGVAAPRPDPGDPGPWA
ncbi:MAG TPA: 16S rRNA (guanine(966)-N(2))-methyltransferase RsmD [Acidimicrobiales bacterium]|nr:16S rRNA (guanine(966)-N(2))-methyltransferase RsmD [Acidimicrobiales bacterium]